MLSDDLTRWFDDELWRVADGSMGDRFATAIVPDRLLANAPTEIWPALMPCDFLPILGNNLGDWLCVRIGTDSSASQIVHWYHGGGDWIPWGTTLAQAIYFDHVRERLPGGGRDHAIAASSAETDEPNQVSQRLTNWAIDRLEDNAVRSLERLSGRELADAMLERRISEPAVLCQLSIDALDNPLISDQMIRSWKINDADHIQQSLFDNRLMDDAMVDQITSQNVTADSVLAQQDWSAVQTHCRRATEIAPDLAWGWDLLGYSYQRSDDVVTAEQLYRQGLECSIFTDQTVRVRTHGFNGDGQKFSALRLIQLGYQPATQNERDYFHLLCSPSADQRRSQVREHFCNLAKQADSKTAHDLWMRAGWDLGAEPMLAFAELIEQASASAAEAGRTGQSQLAITHRNCFRDRYGI